MNRSEFKLLRISLLAIVFLVTLVSLKLIFSDNRVIASEGAIGRYQISADNLGSGNKAWVIDTANGDIWHVYSKDQDDVIYKVAQGSIHQNEP